MDLTHYLSRERVNVLSLLESIKNADMTPQRNQQVTP